MLLLPTNFSEGFMLNMDNRGKFEGEGGSFLIGNNAFGHVGLGGSSATFADPDCNLAFGYLVNKLGGEYLINERGQSLIDEALNKSNLTVYLYLNLNLVYYLIR